MNRIMRITGIVALLFFVTGCSGYRAVGSFGDGIGSGPGLGDLRPGDEVRLHLLSGQTVQGKVQVVSKDSLTLILDDPSAGNVEVEFAVQEFSSVEIREDSGTAWVVFAIVVVGVGVGVSAAVAANTQDAMNGFVEGIFGNNNEGPILSRNQRMAP